MRKLFILTITSLVILGCNYKRKSSVKNTPKAATEQQSNLENLKLDFNEPVFIDSSAVVMYPLTLENNDEEERGLGSSSNYGSPTTYWNIVFYDTSTGKYHLLDNEKKMVIYSYHPESSDAGTSSSSDVEFKENGYNQVDNLLYYSIAISDFNNDGKLNSNDPTYLFVSDKNGRNFKQVSPNNLNVLSWRTIQATNKILLQVTRDSNNDKEFTNNDETVPMVYDLNNEGNSKEIFTSDFKKTLKQALGKQWTKEK